MIDRFVISSLALFILGICLRMSLRLLYGARGPASEDALYLIMRIVGWGLIILPMLVISIAGANWLSLILLAAIIEALIELVLARRAAQRQAVWRLVAGAVGSGRSLIDALRIHQARFSGIVGRWQRRLVADLEHGLDWRQAVLHNAPAVPREAPTFASLVPLGARPSALVDDFDEGRDPAYQQLQQETRQRFAYLANVVLVMIAVLAFVMIQIIPAFEAIYADFDLTLPSLTINVITLSQAFVEILGPPLVILLVLALPVILLIGVLYLCDIPVLQRLTDRLLMFRHRAQVLRLLAAGFDQHKSIDETLGQLSEGLAPYPSAVVRRRLERARRRVTAGESWTGALVQSSLISPADAAVLDAAQLAGNLPWACRMLAHRKVRRASFRLAIIQQFVFVAVVLMLGFVVAVYAVAMLVPLANLIWSLTG